MSCFNIIRSLIEFFIIIGFSVAIYRLSGLRIIKKEVQNDKPVQFNARDFFSIDDID